MTEAHTKSQSLHEVVYRPPAVGATQVPIPITGKGTLSFENEGLKVNALKVASRGRGLLIVVAFIAAILVIVLLRQAFGLDTTYSTGIGGGVGLLLIQALRKPAKEGEAVEQLFPWAKVRKVAWDSSVECLVVVIKGMKPKGGLYIVQPKDSALERRISEHLKRNKA